MQYIGSTPRFPAVGRNVSHAIDPDVRPHGQETGEVRIGGQVRKLDECTFEEVWENVLAVDEYTFKALVRVRERF